MYKCGYDQFESLDSYIQSLREADEQDAADVSR
jgi:hypothetical protein